MLRREGVVSIKLYCCIDIYRPVFWGLQNSSEFYGVSNQLLAFHLLYTIWVVYDNNSRLLFYQESILFTFTVSEGQESRGTSLFYFSWLLVCVNVYA